MKYTNPIDNAEPNENGRLQTLMQGRVKAQLDLDNCKLILESLDTLILQEIQNMGKTHAYFGETACSIKQKTSFKEPFTFNKQVREYIFDNFPQYVRKEVDKDKLLKDAEDGIAEAVDIKTEFGIPDRVTEEVLSTTKLKQSYPHLVR